MALSGRTKLGLAGAALLLLVLAEIAAIVWVASEIGWWTVLILAITTVLGIALLMREWQKAWRGLSEALRSGELPSGKLTDASLVLAGGMLLVLPGLLTDVLGLLLLLPFTRPFIRSGLGWLASRNVPKGGTPTVIKGDVVKDDDTPVPGIERPGEPGGAVVEGTVVDPEDQ